ncbi:MAG: hypothetical protein AAFR65_16525 [Pseudomonadota bacterium]
MADDKDLSYWPQTATGRVDLIGKVGAIILVIFGVVEYFDRKDETRVSRTQELMKEYATGPLRDAQNVINSTILDHLASIEAIRAVQWDADAAATAHADIVQFLVWDSRDADGLVREIDDLLEFYERVTICVETRLCDREVARAYFTTDADWLFENFRPYILQRRENAPGFATISERLIDI